MNIKHKNSKKKPLIILGIALFVLVAGAAGYFFLMQDRSVNPTITKTQNGQKAVSNPNVPGGTTAPGENPANSQPSNKVGGSDTPKLDANIQPIAPSGQFVSNHRPNLSGQPTPNGISSVCTTTPGAHCKLQFQMGSTIKQLPLKATDITGSTQWNWTLQEVGLTQGIWTITAIASNGSKTASTIDSIKLEVRP